MGGLGAAGVSGIFGLVGQALANRASRQSQQEAIDAQKHFYKNRYRWQMADMARAGLNPILSYQQGAPGGPGVGTFSGAPTSPLGGQIVSSAKAGAKLKGELAVLSNQKEITKAQIANVAADTLQKVTQAGANRAQEDSTSATANATRVQTMLQSTALPGARTRRGVDMSPPGEASIWWNQIWRNLIGLGPSAIRRSK